MSKARPFLKWAGGKRKLARQILELAGPFDGEYFEPFVGAGAVFFEVSAGRGRHINDTNSELINTYLSVRDDLDSVLGFLRTFSADKESFLKIRGMDRVPDFDLLPAPLRAARFIFLNKTAYNGLHRVNSLGHFNVPFGKTSGNFIDEKNLREVSELLNAKTGSDFLTKISCGDFVEATVHAKPGDFVYLDPPYIPMSASSSFVSYSQGGFSMDDQLRVRNLFFDLTNRGVSVIASNSDTPATRELYQSRATHFEPIEVNRPINSVGASRGAVSELLIVNSLT